jgi:hypothetical protein
MRDRNAQRFRTFVIVWFGQLVSLVGTSLTGFALALFVYTETGSATQLSLVLLASQLPQIVFTPIAGALVDRWDRRIAMILSDTGAGAATAVLAALLVTDTLQIWHLYPLLAIQGLFQTLQFPAYSAATTLLVRKDQYGRAAGMVQLAEAAGHVIAPAAAGVILVAGGLGAVVAVDVVTFFIAVGTLLLVRFPKPEATDEAEAAAGSIWSEIVFGLDYLRARSGLLALLGYFAVVNLIFGFVGVLIFPLVLGFASEQATGSVVSIGAVGMIAGSVVMSAWGGPRRKVFGVVWGVVLLGVGLILAGLRPSLPLLTIAIALLFFAVPIANASSQAIWQVKVAPDVQGRVFAVRRTLAQISAPLALIAGGPLLDRVLQPLMEPGGGLADSVGAVIGTGAGRGAALFVIVLGALGLIVSLSALAYPRLRNLEAELPDAVLDDSPILPASAEAGRASGILAAGEA